MDIRLRKTFVIGAVAFALAVPALQAVMGFGLSPAEFSRQGDTTLRAAGYAFSIWGLIYAGLVAYAVWQALPRQDGNPVLARVAGPSVAAIVGCGAWILASAFDARWLSVAIIVASAGVLTWGLALARRLRLAASRRSTASQGRRGLAAAWGERVFLWWPLGLLAGWLTVAAGLNILTVLTAEGLLGGEARAAAIVGIVAVTAAALVGLWATRLAAFGVSVAWGLVAVWVAERATKGDVAAVALGAAVLVGAYAVWVGWADGRRRAL